MDWDKGDVLADCVNFDVSIFDVRRDANKESPQPWHNCAMNDQLTLLSWKEVATQ